MKKQFFRVKQLVDQTVSRYHICDYALFLSCQNLTFGLFIDEVAYYRILLLIWKRLLFLSYTIFNLNFYWLVFHQKSVLMRKSVKDVAC